MNEHILQLREDIREVYLNNIDNYELNFGIYGVLENQENAERRYYVYEWFTSDLHKVFYVGKGTAKRYMHIISDMKQDKGELYKKLQNDFGIDYQIVKKDLTEQEALIYESYLIWLREKEGNVLIQSIEANSWWGGFEIESKKMENGIIPNIWVEPFYQRYYDIKPENYCFDEIDLEKMSGVFFKTTFGYVENLKFESQIIEHIEMLGGRVYKTKCLKVKSIIDFGIMSYSMLLELKSKGYDVYNCYQVLEFFDERNKKLTANG